MSHIVLFMTEDYFLILQPKRKEMTEISLTAALSSVSDKFPNQLFIR